MKRTRQKENICDIIRKKFDYDQKPNKKGKLEKIYLNIEYKNFNISNIKLYA